MSEAIKNISFEEVLAVVDNEKARTPSDAIVIAMLEHVAEGKTLAEISGIYNCQYTTVWAKLAAYPEVYAAAKKIRDDFHVDRSRYGRNLADDTIIEKLESKEVKNPKHLIEISESFNKRVNLAEGKVTERIDGAVSTVQVVLSSNLCKDLKPDELLPRVD